jgi:hypothetical protein
MNWELSDLIALLAFNHGAKTFEQNEGDNK